MINKVQGYPTSKNMKETPAFVGIWGFGRTFFPHLSLMPSGKVWDWGSDERAASEKAKMLVKQMKVPGISGAGLSSELDVSGTPRGMTGYCSKDSRRRENL